MRERASHAFETAEIRAEQLIRDRARHAAQSVEQRQTLLQHRLNVESKEMLDYSKCVN